MKILKFNENSNKNEPKVGDYVICYYSDNDVVNDTINNKIGIIVKINYDNNYPFKVKYNISYRDRSITREFKLKNSNSFEFNRSEIIHFSEDKDELEIILNSNKFNI